MKVKSDKIEGYFKTMDRMVIYFIKHPHGVKPGVILLRVMGMFSHALDTISSYLIM